MNIFASSRIAVGLVSQSFNLVLPAGMETINQRQMADLPAHIRHPR